MSEAVAVSMGLCYLVFVLAKLRKEQECYSITLVRSVAIHDHVHSVRAHEA